MLWRIYCPVSKKCSFRYLVDTKFSFSVASGMHSCDLKVDGDIPYLPDEVAIYAKPYLPDLFAKVALIFLIWFGVILIVLETIKLFREKIKSKK